ncbi:hypothetical protein PZA11_005768 [Diplocarpon coronariae]
MKLLKPGLQDLRRAHLYTSCPTHLRKTACFLHADQNKEKKRRAREKQKSLPEMLVPQFNTQDPTGTTAHFIAELPAPWHGSENANRHFRHELPEQRNSECDVTNLYEPPTQFRPFSVGTATVSLSSGFPYTEQLRNLWISPDQWLQFSSHVVKAAKLTSVEDKRAWTAGVASGAAASPFLLVFGPVVGYYTGKSVHKKTVVKKVQERLAQEGDLRSVIRNWNEGIFKERGVQVSLEPPTAIGQVLVDAGPGSNMRQTEKEAKRLAKRFRLVLVPLNSMIHGLGPSVIPENPVPSYLQHRGSGCSSSSGSTSNPVPSVQNLGDVARRHSTGFQIPRKEIQPVVRELPAEHQPAIFELDGTQVVRELE